jgi:hypothetical protein
MITETQSKFLALLEPLFPEGTNLRFLEGTEPDALGLSSIASASTMPRMRSTCAFHERSLTTIETVLPVNKMSSKGGSPSLWQISCKRLLRIRGRD